MIQRDYILRLTQQIAQVVAKLEKQEFSSAKDQLKKSLIIFGFVEEETKLYSIERINTINHANDLLATILSHDQT